jgi:hypothetical protein
MSQQLDRSPAPGGGTVTKSQSGSASNSAESEQQIQPFKSAGRYGDAQIETAQLGSAHRFFSLPCMITPCKKAIDLCL